jgi:preprotein translocase subunit SecF
MFDVVGKKWWWFALSILLIVPGLIYLALGGLKPGIDFTGGSQLEISVAPTAKNVVEALKAQAATEKLELRSVVPSGDRNYLLRFKSLNQEQAASYIGRLNSGLGETKQISFTSVGPTISGTFSWKTVLAGIGLPLRLIGLGLPSDNLSQAIGGVFWASIAIAAYIAFAFRKIPAPYSSWAFGFSAIIALLHDALLVLGVFAILGYFFGIEIDTSFVTALLTVIGFSVHDTIVVFDRVRENVMRHPSMPFDDVVNASVAETFGRSLNTSLTVVFVLSALFLLGGESIRWFVFALLIGIISGTYSSIFNASQLLALWEERRAKRRNRLGKSTVTRPASQPRSRPATTSV